MRRKPYPLEIVEKIRVLQQKDTRGALQKLRRQLESAEIALQRARRAAIDHERAKWKFQSKRAIPEQGCSAAELQREASFACGLSERERLLRDEIVQAQIVCDRLQNEVDALQRALEQVHAKLEAVERHHEKFDAEARRERASETEAETDDLYSIPR